MARLSHPGIVAVHDAGETPDGLLYFVMDFVEGTDVQQMVAARGRFPAEEALNITARVCDALAYAHGKGIIHRDIKPSNVMVDPAGEVKVADFGLAKIISADSGLHTASDVTMGTPDFMAPESRAGAAHVDHRADLYAVGVMLYQMLTGKVPCGRFDPPSRAVPGLDRSLDPIVDRAMQNDRDARYSSAIELRTALDPILTRTVARRTAATASAQRSWKKPALLGGLAVLLAAVAFVVFRPAPPGVKLGLPEAEARRLAGVDAAKPAGSAPEPSLNAAGLAIYPVGVWARCWTAAEEAEQTARRDGEWFLLKTKSHGRGRSGVPMRNLGLRARFRGQRSKDDLFPQMNLRSQVGDFSSVNLYLDPAGQKVFLRFSKEGALPKLAEVRLREKLRPDPKEYLMELYAIGSTLIGRINGQSVTAQIPEGLGAGEFGIYDANADFVRDVEVLNLDGLPEAEARKLIGLDTP